MPTLVRLSEICPRLQCVCDMYVMDSPKRQEEAMNIGRQSPSSFRQVSCFILCVDRAGDRQLNVPSVRGFPLINLGGGGWTATYFQRYHLLVTVGPPSGSVMLAKPPPSTLFLLFSIVMRTIAYCISIVIG